MEALSVTAADGVRVPLDWFAADAPRAALLLMPALGIQARLYTPLASALSAAGCAVAVLEQRGHGRSEVRARRGSRFGMAELLTLDLPAALHWLRRTLPDRPLVIGGHSLGGHMATLFAGQHPERPAGIFHIATPMPWYRAFPARTAWLIRILCAMISLCRVFPGYFPGQWIGFGGRESLPLMRDWRDWALTGRYDFGRFTGLHEAIVRYHGPVLSIALEQDAYSCPAAVDLALAPLVNARLTRLELGPDEQAGYLGHFQWARQPVGVAQAMLEWIAREIPAAGAQP